MCGIVGFTTKYTFENAKDILSSMTDTLISRGPDACGIWTDEERRVYLGHRRLAIIDLTASGSQPQASHSERYVVTFNGEIYNYQDLRANFDSNIFKGTSDTEVLLACLDKYGIDDTLLKIQGAFAFAVYDKKDGRFVLVRDRIGEKPLYYGKIGDSFVFASELKAFHVFPGFSKEINRDALALYLRYGYIPAPYSIYKGVYKLKPGHWLEHGKSSQTPYWSFLDYCKPKNSNPQDEVDTVEQMLLKAVSQQMVADVSVGAFLSGGVDSSLIASIMQSLSSTPINTYTIGFSEPGFNEAHFAKDVASHLGTNHTELYINPKDVLNVIPDLPHIYDEPFADSSQIPTYLAAKLAKTQVKVVLTGDAGDEIFGGYSSYKLVLSAWKTLEKIPAGLRKFAGQMILGVPSSAWDKLGYLSKGRLSGFKLQRGARSMLMSDNFWDMCHEIRCMGDATLSLQSQVPKTIWDYPELFENMDMLGKMMAADTLMGLPYDMLVKVDKAAMGCGLETRAPILNVPLVEYAAGLPSSLKIRNGETKWILRQVLYKRVPRELIERPKSGFSIPIGAWLRRDIKDWADALLDTSRLKSEGYLDANRIEKMWQAHKSGRMDYSQSLWSVLMFQAWLEYWN